MDFLYFFLSSKLNIEISSMARAIYGLTNPRQSPLLRPPMLQTMHAVVPTTLYVLELWRFNGYLW